MKPFTSKHCMQYLTKSSPFNQGKELAEKYYKPKSEPVLREPNLVENVGLSKQVKSLTEGYKKIHPKPVREQIDEITTERVGLLEREPVHNLPVIKKYNK